MEVNGNVTEAISKETQGIKNELTYFTVNMLNLYSQNERSGNPNEDITMHKIKTRHLIIYYLYRIFCKYRDNIMNVIPIEDINIMYNLLNIPENSRGCIPMAGKLSNKKQQLDVTLFTLIKIFNDFNINQKGKLAPDKFEDMLAFFKSKENIKKILEDFKVLDILIPNLSNTNVEYDIFNKEKKREALIDLGIEPSNDDVVLTQSNTTSTSTPPTGEKSSNLDNTLNENKNNALEKELENNNKSEFNSSEIAVQNTPNIEQNELPEIKSLDNNNQDITQPNIMSQEQDMSQSNMMNKPPVETPIETPGENLVETPIETPVESPVETPVESTNNSNMLNEPINNNASKELNKL